jgi:Mg2+/citrate symporter
LRRLSPPPLPRLRVQDRRLHRQRHRRDRPVAGIFIFAILYFGIMNDAGMLDPLIDRILSATGNRPTRVVIALADLDLGEHQKFSIPFLFGASLLMTIVCVALNVFPL